MKHDIHEYSLIELENCISKLQFETYRASQIYNWLYKNYVGSYDEMVNLPKKLKDSLNREVSFFMPQIVEQVTSKDGTVKYLLELKDKCMIECVSIPGENNRLTLCCSTQVGCPIGCSFCLTGMHGFIRNLSIDEIVNQYIIVQKQNTKRITNIVLMGQGEPLLNLNSTLKALKILNSPEGVNLGARHITISTSGIIKSIKELMKIKEQYILAVSLHSADQKTRDLLIPHLSHQSLHELKEALCEYIKNKNQRITFEYCLIKDINDSNHHLLKLIKFCRGIKCHINIIPFNESNFLSFKTPSKKKLYEWKKILESHNIETTIRQSKGRDILGACGQLYSKSIT